MVPWQSTNNQCESHIQKLAKRADIIEWLETIKTNAFAGFQYDSATCLLPCTRVAVDVKLTNSLASVNGDTFTDILFDKTMKVRTISPSYTFTDLLVEMGSSLGLWLGREEINSCSISKGVMRTTGTPMDN